MSGNTSGQALPAAFGRYTPVELLGSGAFGTVYRAHDPLIGRFVAVKVMRLDALDDEQKADYRERFRIEATAGGRCQHPAIVGIFDAGEAHGEPFLVMEYVTGRSLAAILADPAARHGLDALAVMTELLDALGYAHAQGIIHRDIKPANVIVTPQQRIKVADFGIARLDGGNMTLAGDMLGTPSYMAPEQASGAAIDQRTDLFSAAAIFFAILTGRPPFLGSNMADTLVRLTNETEADVSALAEPHARFAPVLRQALAKRPDQRFPDAKTFADALHQAASGQPEDDRTRIIPAARPPAKNPPVTMSPAAIPQDVIERAAAELAIHIGPIARLQVANAARQAASEAEFFAILSQSLPDARQASRFLRAAGQTGTLAATQPLTAPPQNSPAHGYAPHAIEAARAILAAHTGPIASLLISRALVDAPPLDTLLDRLAASASSPTEAANLRGQLHAALTGKS
jgi:serine/threonine-protein kinase